MSTLVIQLILIRHMAKHFVFVNPRNPRLPLMQVMLKCGDISNLPRPFELAEAWRDVFCHESLRQGDLEMVNRIEYTSFPNDRGHLDKPKFGIRFYPVVCLRLYVGVARASGKRRTGPVEPRNLEGGRHRGCTEEGCPPPSCSLSNQEW
jgi:hypothetical protein